MLRFGLTRRSFIANVGASFGATTIRGPAEALVPPDAMVSWHDRSITDHNKKYAQSFNDGLGLVSLCLYGERDDARCVAVVAPRPPGIDEQQFVGLSADEWRQRVAEMAKRGFGPTIVTATGPANNPLLGAVFRPMPVLSDSAIDLSPADFTKRNKGAMRKATSRLAWVDSYGTHDDLRLAAVWTADPIPSGWLCEYNEETADAMRARLAVLEPLGARVAHLAMMPSGNCLALLDDRGGEVPLWNSEMTGGQYTEEFRAQLAKGRHPIRVSGKGSGNNTRFSMLYASKAPSDERAFRTSGPVTVPEIDAGIEKYMKANGLRGVAFAILDRTRLVYAKGYTWAERDYPDVQPTTLFRQASVSKLFVALALYQFMQEHPSITLETKMQTVLQLRTPDNKPPVDARFNDITIRHLLESTSGLDNNFIFRSLEATAAAKSGLPATPLQLERYGASLALNGEPGDPKHVVYSNAGYFMAGRVLAKLRGTADYIQALEPLLKPLQMKRVRLSRTLLALQAPDEARYHDYSLSVSKSIRSDQRAIVPTQYGAWDCDLAEGAGGLSVAITDIARIAAILSQPQGNPVFTPETYHALFENAANATKTLTGPEAHGYHGFDSVKRLSGGTGYRGTKGGFLTGSQSAIDVNTSGLSFVLAVNGNEHEGVGNAWYSLTQPFAKKYNWPEGDLFPMFGMASLAAI